MNKTTSRRVFISGSLSAFMACVLPKAIAESNPATNLSPDNALTQLSALSEDELVHLLSELYTRSQNILTALVEQLASDKSTGDIKLYAAYFLGESRLPAAVPALLEHITLHDKFRLNVATWVWWGQYPAVEALIKIGQPAVSSVISVLGTSEDALTRRLCLDVLTGVEQDSAVVRLILKNSITHETNAVFKSRIQSAIDIIKS